MPSQPMSGIMAWKRPKRKDMRRKDTPSSVRRIMAETIDTVKQSIARAIAKRIISNRLIDD